MDDSDNGEPKVSDAAQRRQHLRLVLQLAAHTPRPPGQEHLLDEVREPAD